MYIGPFASIPFDVLRTKVTPLALSSLLTAWSLSSRFVRPSPGSSIMRPVQVELPAQTIVFVENPSPANTEISPPIRIPTLLLLASVALAPLPMNTLRLRCIVHVLPPPKNVFVPMKKTLFLGDSGTAPRPAS